MKPLVIISIIFVFCACVICIIAAVVLSQQPSKPSCKLIKPTESEAKDYDSYKGSINNSDAFNLNFELFSIDSSINGNTVMGIYNCPQSLKDQKGAKESFEINGKTYEVVYERKSDTEYRLGFKVDGKMYYYNP